MRDEHVTYLAPRICAAFEQPRGALEHAIGTWVAYSVRYARAFTVERVEIGHDCTDRVVPTGGPLSALPLETVGDFLEQATGALQASYLDGCGFVAETYHEELWHRVRDAVGDLVERLLADAPASVRDAFIEDDDPYGALAEQGATEDAQLAWQRAYAGRALQPILRHYDFAARRQRQIEESTARAEQRRLTARRALAQPLIALLSQLLPSYVDSARAHALWSACEAIARVAESEAQWHAFVLEAQDVSQLSLGMRKKLSERADEIWARARAAK